MNRKRSWKFWLIVFAVSAVVAVVLWIWLFPWLDQFVNDPNVGGV